MAATATPPAPKRARRTVAVYEIGELSGRTRQRAWQLTQLKDFPKPYDNLRCGTTWKRQTVIDYLRRKGLLLPDDQLPDWAQGADQS